MALTLNWINAENIKVAKQMTVTQHLPQGLSLREWIHTKDTALLRPSSPFPSLTLVSLQRAWVEGRAVVSKVLEVHHCLSHFVFYGEVAELIF